MGKITALRFCLLFFSVLAVSQEKPWIEVTDKSGGPFPGMAREYTLQISKSGSISCHSTYSDGKQTRSSQKESKIPATKLVSLAKITDSDSLKAVPAELPERRGGDYFSTKTFVVRRGNQEQKAVVKNYFPTVSPSAYPATFRKLTRAISQIKESAFKDAKEPWQACFDEDQEHDRKENQPCK